jgi:hypothetical protein
MIESNIEAIIAKKEAERKERILRLETQIKQTEKFKRKIIKNLQFELEETKRNRVVQLHSCK